MQEFVFCFNRNPVEFNFSILHNLNSSSNHILRLYVAILLTCIAISSFCQKSDRMETDRPDQTESPFIVKKGFLQNESGFNFNRISSETDYYLPTNLIKYGINEKLELRYTFIMNLREKLFKYRSESIGLKYLIAKNKILFPQSSIIAHYHFSEVKRDLTDMNKVPHSIADIVFTSQNDLTRKISIGYNFGIEFHTNGKHEGIFRMAPGINIGNKTYAYVEIFGRFPLKIYNDTWFDGGVAYYINDNFKIDISAGRSFKFNQDAYIALGLSTRCKILNLRNNQND